jgi:rhodanese-related sulfurtransferase
MAGDEASLTPENMPRISIDELKGMLGNPDVVIIDVRKDKDWKAADRKIPGAYREDWQTAEQWAPKYPQDKTIVLYCT